jgi:hypothetical protein
MRSAIPFAISTVLLASAWVEKQAMRTPSVEAQAYQQRVVQRAARIPASFGLWIGQEREFSRTAARLLHPNVAISRVFHHMVSGDDVGFLFVQCSDARDLLGHYPPACYPAQGWIPRQTGPLDVKLDGIELDGRRYAFESSGADGAHYAIVVRHVIILPDGRTCADMDQVDRAARDHRSKFFGAAQLQVVCDADMPAERQQQAFADIVGAYMPLIDVIRSGEATHE